MRAVAYRHSRPVTEDDAFVDVTLDRPVPGPRDLLVRVEAVSVNPVIPSSMPARTHARARMRSFIWSTSASSGGNRQALISPRRRRCR
jgi:hypothetical protein